MYVSQKFVKNLICVPETHRSDFVYEFLSKMVAKM
jgi:hypothetical protein